ncbi:hypothetical protein BLX87_14700 [Bacillus sp. VT-16-64]|nr:hypothetical protein BLX87_14700 [Bacillus sp. VT-16-64]
MVCGLERSANNRTVSMGEKSIVPHEFKTIFQEYLRIAQNLTYPSGNQSNRGLQALRASRGTQWQVKKLKQTCEKAWLVV